jgi:hypothetical protein
MGAICYHGPLACETKTSKQRRAIPNPKKGKIGVKGYTKSMVKNFLRMELSPKIQDMKAKEVIVCMDKGLAFKEDEAKEQFRLGGASKVKAVWILPTNTAKYVSPLDNTLWHSLKERVRARKPKTEAGTTRIVKQEFMRLPNRRFKVITESANLHEIRIQVKIFTNFGFFAKSNLEVLVNCILINEGER